MRRAAPFRVAVMCVVGSKPPAEEETARDTIARAAKTMFPDGRI